MKKIITIGVVIAIGYFIIVKRVTVDAGEEAVVIKKPWFFGEKGVQKQVISTGTIWGVRSSEIKIISLKPFNIEELFHNVFTKDNIPIDFNVTITFKNQKGKGAILVEKFRNNKQWYKNLLSKPIHNTTEISIKKNTFDDIYYKSNRLEELRKAIIYGVRYLLKDKAIPVNLINVTINKITPPKELIKTAIDKKVEKEKIEFHKLRRKAQELSAKADKAYMKEMNMTPSEYIKMREIELNTKKLSNQRYAIEKAKDSNGSIKIVIDMGK
ncbi:MAG: SPFH domain-containing protein [Sulfurovaceae bacterium]|nr:SPFH domain-containing protein [Sulfurovaceae bacterium]